MPLQEAVEAQEHAGLCLVAESPGAHQRDVVAHQITQDTTEGWQTTQRFERPIRLRREQCPQDCFATPHAVVGAELSDWITADRPFAHEEV
jgi:hypothetical protein